MKIKILYMLIPIMLSLLAAREKSLWLALATFFLDFIFISIVPYCKKRENVWMFILVAFTSVPINIFIAKDFLALFSIFRVKGIYYYLTLTELVLVLSSIEELVAGFFVRFLYRKQDDIFEDEDEEEEEDV